MLNRKHVAFDGHIVTVEDIEFRNSQITSQLERRSMDLSAVNGVLKGVLNELAVSAVGLSLANVATGASLVQGKRAQVDSLQSVVIPPDTNAILWIKHAELASSDENATRLDDEGDPQTVWYVDGFELGLTDYGAWMWPADKLALARVIQSGAVLVVSDYRVYAKLSMPLGPDVVETASIQDGAVTEDKLADDAVGTEKVKDLAVTEDKLADDAVATDKLQDSAVTFAKLGDASVGFQKLHDSGVTANKIATGSCSELKHSDGTAVVPLYLSADSAPGEAEGVFADLTLPAIVGDLLEVDFGTKVVKLAGVCPRPSADGPIRRLKLQFDYQAISTDAAGLKVWLVAWLDSDPPDNIDPDAANAKLLRTHAEYQGPASDTAELSLTLADGNLAAGRTWYAVILHGGSDTGGDNAGNVKNVNLYGTR